MRLSAHPFDEAKARAVAWLTAWDSQGAHRTGTASDEASARWLANEAAALGVEVTTEVFELDRLDPVTCHLELDGERISAVPAFDAPGTGADGVTGRLSLREQDEAILVAKLRSVPEAIRPVQERPDPDDDATREWRAQGRDPKAHKQK